MMPACFAAEKIDVNTMRNNMGNNHPDIKYYKSCDGESGICIKTFAETQVQTHQAIAIAQEYAKTKYGHDIICSATYRTDWNDDYIKCSDKTGAPNYYEFKFDDVKESIDKQIQDDTYKALCKIHNGFTVKDNNACFFYKTNFSAAQPDFMSALAKFNYSASCEPNQEYKNGLKVATTNSYICYPQFNSKSANSYELKTAFGINPRKFAHLQIKSSADLEFLLKRYTQRMVESSGQTLTNFYCSKGFQTYHTHTITNPNDDILACVANGKQIDFLFDDINENFDWASNAGTAGLTCIADVGGVYDGKNCNGLTRTQCEEINKTVPTKWDDTLDTCTLTDASKASTLNTISNIGGTALTGAALIAITVLTSGTGTMAIIAISGTQIATTGALVTSGTELYYDSQARDFIANSAQCQTPECAENTLKNFIENTAIYYQEKDSQVWNALDDELNRIINLLPESSVSYNALRTAIAEAQDIENFASWPSAKKIEIAGQGLILFGSVLGVTGSIGQHWKTAVTTLKNMGNASKTITILSQKILKIANDNIRSNIGRAADSYSVYDNVSSIIQ